MPYVCVCVCVCVFNHHTKYTTSTTRLVKPRFLLYELVVLYIYILMYVDSTTLVVVCIILKEYAYYSSTS